MNYSESKLDDPIEKRYDSYYHVGTWLQIYFLNDECVLLRMIDIDEGSSEHARTTMGIHPGSTYSQMVELYGDSYEMHSYSERIIYTIYRYSVDDCIYEFGIPDENSDTIYNIDIYLLSQAPIYEYGEEILEAN